MFRELKEFIFGKWPREKTGGEILAERFQGISYPRFSEKQDIEMYTLFYARDVVGLTNEAFEKQVEELCDEIDADVVGYYFDYYNFSADLHDPAIIVYFKQRKGG